MGANTWTGVAFGYSMVNISLNKFCRSNAYRLVQTLKAPILEFNARDTGFVYSTKFKLFFHSFRMTVLI